MRKNKPADLVRARAKRKSNTDFTDAFERGICEQSIKTDSRQHQREPGKDGNRKLNRRCAPQVSRTRSVIGRASKTGSDESIEVDSIMNRAFETPQTLIVDLTKSVRLVR